ncbi:MAG TPA: carbohydrate ABC transporter permease [Atribacteraceae bacterium]|nr:carbohydrate ABC transporter permease [Atribacteraceae bacterium]
MDKTIRRWKGVQSVAIYTVLFIVSFFMIFPIYWTFTTAFKAPKDVLTSPPKFIPFVDFQPSLFALQELGLVSGADRGTRTTPHSPDEIIRVIRNSIVIAVGSTLLSLLIGCLAAYGLVRFNYRRWNNQSISFFILSQRMMPPIVLVIPYFILFRHLNLLDTLLGVAIAHSIGSIPFVVWIMRGFFISIPRELEDSARIDGCSYLGAFLRVIIPLSIPGLVAASVFVFVFSWNELLFALTLSFRNARTIPVLLTGLTHGGAPLWWSLSAMLLISMLPVIVMTIFIQRYIVSGLTLGAIK